MKLMVQMIPWSVLKNKTLSVFILTGYGAWALMLVKSNGCMVEGKSIGCWSKLFFLANIAYDFFHLFHAFLFLLDGFPKRRNDFFACPVLEGN